MGKDVTETTGQSKPNSSEKTLSQKPTQIPKELISGIKELLDRMSALEAKVKENTKTTLVSHDLTMNIRELRNCINTMDAKGKHEFQDVTSNIKELRDRV